MNLLKRSPTRNRTRPWQLLALALGLAVSSAAHAAISASPNPSANGSYTVSWSAVAGATRYQLLEGGKIAYQGTARSKAFSGKAAGTHAYTLTYCQHIGFPVGATICNLPSGFDALTVTVSGGTADPAPAAPTLTVPASSTTGSYSVSWTKPAKATRFELEERAGAGAWSDAYSGTANSKAFSGKGTGAYSYRVRACAGQTNCGGWSATGNVRVTVPLSTLSANRTTAPGGDYTISWTASALSSGYKLLENFNNGAATASFTVSGTSKRFTNQKPGSYAYNLQVCFNLLGSITCAPVSNSVTVTVPAGTLSASPSPCTIPHGGTRCSTTVAWSTQYATKPCVYLKSSEGKFACGASGSKVAPWITKAGRTLELKSGGTYAGDTLATVFVKGVPAVEPTVSASFDHAEIKKGEDVTLTWSSTDATSCSGSRSIGSTSTSGTKSFTPAAVGGFSVKVTCTGAGGSGDDTATVDVVDVPDAPAKPTVTATGSAKLTVAWTAPDDNGAAITRYDVRHRLNASNADWGDPEDAGTGTTKVLGSLAANTGYQVQVRAVNKVGESGWSASANGKTLRGAVAPPPTPASFTVPSSDADGNFRVSWAASSGATRYELRKRFGTGQWADAYEGAETSADITGLHITAGDDRHGFEVRACASTCSGWSAEKKVAVSGALAADPSTSTDGAYRVWWTPARATTLYQLQESTDGGVTWSASFPLAATVTGKSFSGKAPGTYTYRIRSCVIIGLIPTSRCEALVASTLEVKVLEPLPAPTLSVAPNPAPAGTYRVSWTATPTATSYTLQERINGGDWSNVTGVAGRSKDFPNRTAAVYGYQVKACDGDGDCGPWSDEATVRVPPAAPTVSNAPACGGGKARVSWTAVPGAASYALRQRTGTGPWAPAYSGTDNGASLSLVAGDAYSFQARACTAPANCGAWSATATLTAPDCAAPAVPTGLKVEPAGPNAYKVAWNPLSESGITYQLQERTGGGAWADAYDGTATETSFTGKANGDYDYQVQACNAGNACSDWSSAVAATLPFPPPAPAGLDATAPTAAGGYTVSWDAVAWGSASVTYRLEEAFGRQTTETAVTGTSKAFTGRPVGTHAHRVRACAPASNCGPRSGPVEAKVPPAAPTLTVTASCSASGSQAAASWNAVAGATGYELQQREGAGQWQPADSSGTQATLPLTAGSQYGFQVRACAGTGNCGAWSATATVAAPDCPTPSAPTGLSVLPTGPDAYKVDWDSVSGTQIRYELQERTGSGAWEGAYKGTATEKSFTAKADGDHEHQVRACTAADLCGPWAGPASVTVPIPPPAPSGLDATAPTAAGGYTVSWDAVAWGGATVTYRLEEAFGQRTTEAAVAATSKAFAGQPAGDHAYRVRACAPAANCSAWTDPLTVTVAAVPTSPVETPPSPYSAQPSLVTAAEVKAIDSTGTVPGAFRVTESGAASYRIPIYATPGTAGVTPELALAYNSQAGNGIAGLGWSLEGGSAVTRCRATRHQDAAARPIRWDADDRFCLDGQRLVLETGTYGSPGSTYRTEIDSFAIVTAVGGAAGHPDRFEVRRRDGSVAHYGNVPGGSFKDAKRTNGRGQALTWALKRFEDSVGNPVLHLYAGGADSHRLEEVRYAYGAKRNIGEHHAAVKLIYEDRDDDMTGYVAGHAFASRKRLAKVRTLNHHGGGLRTVRELRLAYGGMGGNRTSRLASVTECAGDGAAAACKPATTFTWPANAAGFKATASGSAKLTPRKDRGVLAHHPADVNGDGLMDLVWVEWDADGAKDTDHHLKYALSDGSMLKPAAFDDGSASIEHKEDVGRSGANVLARPIDYNGDGRADVALWRARDPVWRVHLSAPTVGGGWRLQAATVETPVTDRLAEFTDLNGDGLVDAVYGRGATIRARHLERDPAQPDTSSKPHKFGAEATLHTVAPRPGPFGTLTPTASTGIWAGGHDFNGDGRADFIARTRFELDLGQLGRVSQTVHGPYVQDAAGAWRLYADFREDALHAADFNGDGLTDLVRESRIGGDLYPYLEVNTGAGFASRYSSLALTAKDVRLLPPADHNGDGHPDLLWHDRKREAIRVLHFDPNAGALGSALAHQAVAVRNAGRKHAHLFADADGDGALDYLRLSDTSGKGKLETFPSNNAGRFPRQASAIVNGLGAVTQITHESLARTPHYERLDVRRTVPAAPAQFCYAFAGGAACLPYGNPIDSELETVDEHGNPLPQAQVLANAKALLDKRTKAFHAEINAGWTLPAGAQTLGKAGPVLEFRAPLPVVTEVSGTAPAAGAAPGGVATDAVSKVEHFYADAKVQAMGRGPLGFGQLKTRDAQTGVEATTRYRHDFPFTGMPISTTVRTSSGRLLSESTTTWELTGHQPAWEATAKASGTAALGALKPHAAKAVERSYDLNTDGPDGKPALLATVTTTTARDAHGNATTVTAVTEGGGRTFTTKTVNEYGSSDADKRLGRLSKATVTHSRRKSSESAGQALTAVRTSAFTYHGQAGCTASTAAHAGLLCKEVVEPDHERLKVTTTHSYDAFGNRVRSKVEHFDDVPVPGQAAPTGSSRLRTRCDNDTAAYGARGRFVKARFDCLGRKLSEVVARDAHGSPTEARRFLDAAGSKFATDRAWFTPGGAEFLNASATGAHALTTRARGAPKGSGAASCPAGTAFHERARHGGGGGSVACLDALAREVRTATRGFDGKWIHVDTEYDSLGRVRHVSEPHYADEAQCSTGQGDSKCWTVTDHDILGRIVKVTGPDGSATSFAHKGFGTATTNALGQTAKEERNALGETAATEDHLGGRVEFARDAQGNVTGTTRRKPSSDASPAPASVATSATFDLLGRMTVQDDPDLGRTAYRHNSLGELRCRQDAVGNLTVNAYDGLGRMASRRDHRALAGATCKALSATPGALEGDASWTYDAGTGLGQPSVEADSASGYKQTLTYDALGRPSTTETVPGTGADTHHGKATYDAYGRPFQAFDASRTEAKFDHNGVRYAYSAHGHLERLQDAVGTWDGQGRFTPNATYRTVTAMDARGNVTAETLGNGVKRTRAFDGRTGRLLGIKAGKSSANGLQDLAYQWDALGNLKSRTRGSGGAALTETFCHDGLNRLFRHRAATGGADPDLCGRTGPQLDGTKATSHDGYGNIRFRTGVGTYAYGADSGGTGRPHAVASVTRADNTRVTHAYDANGSLTSSSDGRTVSYAAFGKATSIAKGGHTSAFAHGPNRSRFKRVDTDGNGNPTTTLYLGSVEKVTHPDGTVTVRRRIGGTAIEVEGPAAGSCEADAVRYVLRDHLGSVDGLANAQGALVQPMSFAAWGTRRNPDDWTGLAGAAAAAFDGCATTRGFTGHEMLDAVGAVHMNGRLYDPALGRFLRADPFVQFPSNLQSHNRYSYALNNPLAHTDPSGHFLKGLIRPLASIAISVWLPGAGFWTGTGLFAANGVGAVAVSGFIAGAVGSGSLKGAVVGAFSAAAFHGVGDIGFKEGFVDSSLKALSHGAVGGITSMLGGGRFGHGFVSAGAAQALSGPIGRIGGRFQRTAAAAAVGGTLSAATGGKFANGAITGAFSRAFNDELHERAVEAMEAKLTDEQRDFVEKGQTREFWESRLKSGDPIAQLALDILDNKGLGVRANERLQDFAMEYGIELKLSEVSLKLMEAHAKATEGDGDGLLRAAVIAQYHHEVFATYGLPPETFGGTPFFGALWEAKVHYTKPYWCEACPEE